jgi:hypothetical protein
MLIWYFLTIPELPWEVTDQTGTVSLIEYSLPVGTLVKPGDTIAEVETWWARLRIIAKYPCRMEKRFFDSPALRGITVGIGQPIALAFCDPEDVPKEKPETQTEVVCFKREKQRKKH